jgi:hypothetical protein
VNGGRKGDGGGGRWRDYERGSTEAHWEARQIRRWRSRRTSPADECGLANAGSVAESINDASRGSRKAVSRLAEAWREQGGNEEGAGRATGSREVSQRAFRGLGSAERYSGARRDTLKASKEEWNAGKRKQELKVMTRRESEGRGGRSQEFDRDVERKYQAFCG